MGSSLEESGKHTLIVVRRTLTEPDTFFAGVIFEIFAARFEAMAVFNAEMAPSLRLGCWDPVSMVGTRGSCGGTVGLEEWEEGSEP